MGGNEKVRTLRYRMMATAKFHSVRGKGPHVPISNFCFYTKENHTSYERVRLKAVALVSPPCQ